MKQSIFNHLRNLFAMIKNLFPCCTTTVCVLNSSFVMTKSIANSDVKELPSPDEIPLDTTTTKGIEKSSEVTTTSTETPEIKPKSADLENNKDPNIGMSDLTKP